MKKISCLFGIAVSMMVLLCGCGGEKLEYSIDDAKENTTYLLQQFVALDDASIEEILSSATSTLGEQNLVIYEGVESYKAILEEVGTPTGEYGEVELKEAEDEVIATMEVECKERAFTLEVIYYVDNGNLVPTSIACTAVYSLGEMLGSAAGNTLLGMGSVFIILIVISAVIGQLKNIDMLIDKAIQKLSERKKRKQTAKKATRADIAQETAEVVPAAPVAEETEELVDDLELVAVIAAAIAMTEGVSPDGFVVRSIRRSAKWKRA
ncbi:MAG: hypothetical protein E7269_03410 [Lachnospiraceae bacterium]|nr:hypothetical protein [Lachnospiraceae bacterium]